MAAITPLKKSPYMIEWIKTDPSGKASEVQKNEWPVAPPLFK